MIEAPLARGREEVPVPALEYTLKECRKHAERRDDIEGVKLYLQEYFKNAIDNTDQFSSKNGLGFPYTVVRLSDIARSLLAKSKHPEASGASTVMPGSKEFIFGTFFRMDIGHHYHWIEHGIDQIAKKLPDALQALHEGRPIEEAEVYGMGSPIGEFGNVTADEYPKEEGDEKERPNFRALGTAYAEFVASQKGDAQLIRLWGVSMGASVAGTTGESLVNDGAVTQSFDDAKLREKPMLRVVMESPVATDAARSLQIPLGFGVEAVYRWLTSSYASAYGKSVGAFEATLKRHMTERADNRMTSQTAPGQMRVKSELVSALLKEFMSGVPVQSDLKVEKIVGTYDPLMLSPSFMSAAKFNRSQNAGDILKQNLMPRKGMDERAAGEMPQSPEGHRTWAIENTHTPTVVRESYFRRLARAGGAVDPVMARENFLKRLLRAGRVIRK